MEIFIKNRIRKKKQFQFFMHSFVESAIKLGFKVKNMKWERRADYRSMK